MFRLWVYPEGAEVIHYPALSEDDGPLTYMTTDGEIGQAPLYDKGDDW